MVCSTIIIIIIAGGYYGDDDLVEKIDVKLYKQIICGWRQQIYRRMDPELHRESLAAQIENAE